MILMKSSSVQRESILVSDIIRNFRKDVIIEFRTRNSVNSALAFCLVTTVAVSSFSGGVPFPPNIQSILLWIILFFAAMNSLSHVFTREIDQGTDLFLRCHSSSEAIFIAKLLFNILLIMVVLAVIAPVFVLLLQVEVGKPVPFLIALLAGGITLAVSTTLFGAMVARADQKGALFTVISMPILLPMLWVAVMTTHRSLEPGGSYDWRPVVFLLAFSGMMAAISLLLFRFVWIEE